MKMGAKNLDQALDLVPVERKKVAVAYDPENENLRKMALDAMAENLTEINTAISEMGEAAFQSQHSRAYEVLGGLIEKKQTIATDLLNEASKGSEGPKTINNTLNISSSELLDIIKDKMK